MKAFLFKKIPVIYRTDFENYYTFQNLDAMRYGSLVFFAVNAAIRLFYTLSPETFADAKRIYYYNIFNWFYLAITPLFYWGSVLLRRSFKYNPAAKKAILVCTLTFGLYIILCGMAPSFVAMSNPRNTLTMFLVSLIAISIMCVLEYTHALLLTITTGIIFTAVLFQVQHKPAERVYNEIAALVVLTTFYFISRTLYAFKAQHYLDLNIILQKNKEIEKANAFKNDVLGIVAHDLRNPISSIESVTMIMELDPVDDDMQDNINMIKASCVKARTIVEDLLEVARNDGSSIIETQPTEIREYLQNLVDVWRFSLAADYQLVLVMPPQPVYAAINAEKFQRVVDNLIGNAIKFSQVDDRIEINLTSTSQQIYIEVKDMGMGIPADMLPYIFDRFSKAGRTGLKGEKSTGLGLSIARQIVEKHQGVITVSSIVNQGSSFVIQLPQLQ